MSGRGAEFTLLTLASPWSVTNLQHNPPPFLDDLPMKTYQCVVCGFVYDEAQGRPEDGIAPGTKWDDVPADWECPDCGVGKSDFEMIEI
jgi:rubredoxin